MSQAHDEVHDTIVGHAMERRIPERLQHRWNRKTLGGEEIPEPARPERVDHLERPARPAVAELHGLVDGHDLVGHVRHERRRVAERAREHPAREAPGRAPVLGQRPKPIALPGERGLGRGLHHGAKLPGPQVHDFARVRPSAVEAAAPLVAGGPSGDEIPHHRDPFRHPLKGVVGGQRHRQARGDVEHQVEADEVVEAEQPRLRDAHRPAHDRIRLFHTSRPAPPPRRGRPAARGRRPGWRGIRVCHGSARPPSRARDRRTAPAPRSPPAACTARGPARAAA